MSTREVEPDVFLSRAVELTVRIAIVALLVVWCFQILRPFIVPVVWGAIISVAVHPAQLWLTSKLGGRQKLAATLLTVLGLLILLVPLGLFAGSLVESAQALQARIAGQPIAIPPPPADVADWPLVGKTVHEVWAGAATNLGDTAKQFSPQLKAVGGWVLAAGAGTGAAVVQFVVSLLIAGFFLVSASGGVSAIGAVTRRVAGAEGERYLALAAQTVRSVAVGILGVAVIQSALLGIGFVAVGVPHAGIWALLCLGLAVLQLPTFLVVLPIVFYAFSVETTAVAVVFTIWSLVAGLSDNVLKPILLGRGATVPMLVIFLGAIGGFILSGFIGLFIGAIVLSLGYEITLAWIADAADDEGDGEDPTAPRVAPTGDAEPA